MELIDPDPSRAFRTVAVRVLVRVLAEQDWQGDAATDVVLARREAATDQQCETGADREADEGVCERGHAAAEDCSEGRGRGVAAAAAASSSNDACPATTSDCQCSAGMLLRCAQERAVWSETPRSSASVSGPALLTISECVLITP